jgi:hypothetical protein
MRKLLVALVALTAAAALVLVGLPALAAGPRSFTTDCAQSIAEFTKPSGSTME